jgi:hypothetical protein
MKDLKYYKKIEIPHVRFTVYFMDLSKLQGVPKLGAGYTCVFEDTFSQNGKTNVCIFLQDIVENVKKLEFVPYIAHEIMHALQILCENTGMKIEEEKEHTAYIMHYLLENILPPCPVPKG